VIFTEPALFGYVFWSQDREKNVWLQVVKDRKGNVVGNLGTWREATEEEVAAGLETRPATFKIASDCPCGGNGEINLRLVRVE